MDTRKLSHLFYKLTDNTPVGLESAETIRHFIDATVNECIQNKTFDDNVRSALNVALEMYAVNVLDGLQNAVLKAKEQN